MEFLGTSLNGVVAPIGMKSVVTHDQVTHENGNQTGQQQDHEPGEDLPRFETLRLRRKWALGIGRKAGGRNSPVCARQPFCFPAGGKSECLVVRYVSHDSLRQAGALHLARLFAAQLLARRVERSAALPYLDSAGWAARPAGR